MIYEFMSDIQSEKLAAEAAEKAWFEIYQYRPHSWMLMMDTEKAFRMATRAATLALDRVVAARSGLEIEKKVSWSAQTEREQLAAAQEDTKRLDWLLSLVWNYRNLFIFGDRGKVSSCVEIPKSSSTQTFRDAIDAAMNQKP